MAHHIEILIWLWRKQHNKKKRNHPNKRIKLDKDMSTLDAGNPKLSASGCRYELLRF
jgi:hypothetical protein